MIALIVVGVMPSMLGVVVAYGQRTIMLELNVVTPRVAPAGEIRCADLNAPRAILMRISRDEVLVGEDGRAPRRMRALSALQRYLRRLKDERPERQHVIFHVDDGVSLQRIVTILDLLRGLEMQAFDVDVSPDQGVFDDATWVRARDLE